MKVAEFIEQFLFIFQPFIKLISPLQPVDSRLFFLFHYLNAWRNVFSSVEEVIIEMNKGVCSALIKFNNSTGSRSNGKYVKYFTLTFAIAAEIERKKIWIIETKKTIANRKEKQSNGFRYRKSFFFSLFWIVFSWYLWPEFIWKYGIQMQVLKKIEKLHFNRVNVLLSVHNFEFLLFCYSRRFDLR